MRKVNLITIFFLVTIVFQINLSAQYFGRNKVQYEDFDFKVMHSDHFDIYYYPQAFESVKDAKTLLEEWNQRFPNIFNLTLREQPIILYANHPDFQQTNAISGMIPQSTGGVTEGYINRVVIPLTGVYKENNHVLGHELVHAYQYTIIKSKEGGLRSAGRLPLWFVEGMAEYLTIGSNDPLTAMWMRDAVLNDDVPTIEEVATNQKYFPYRYGHAIWNFIASNWGDESVNTLFHAALNNTYRRSFEIALEITEDSLSSLWQQSVKQTYGVQLEELDSPDKVGKKIIGGEESINLSPVISPDGKYIAVISRQELFSLDLYLIDAKSGKVIRKLVSSQTNEHFDALQFMNSAGSWSPDGRKFAFVTIDNGDHIISTVDVSNGQILQTISLDDVNGISGLAWSPDGTRLAIAGTSGGISDLYIYDLDRNSQSQLTDDKYAQIQPSWSPDGNKIVFITDEGENTDADNFKFGNMKIGFIELETGEKEFISVSSKAKHINPSYSPDGKSIYFVSDPDGISDIYRYSFDEAKFYKLTNIATGITGLTELSPALSVAKENGKLVFTVFDKMNYIVRAFDEEELSGIEYKFDETLYEAATALPPVGKSEQGIVSSYLKEPKDIRLSDIKINDYEPSLRVLNAGYTSIGIGVNRFGASLGGATNIIWTDILGNQWLSVAAQANGGLKDIGAQAAYLWRGGRWNYGFAAGHIPYTTGGITRGVDTINVNGTPTLANETTIVTQRVFSDRAAFLLEYPISENRRFEFSTGYNLIYYDIETRTFTTLGGLVLDVEEGELDAPSALHLFNTSAAYVGDYSFSGFTSPIDGSRFRFETEPTLGSLNYVSFLADYRHYFFAEPFTFAFRALHYGRYFGDSESDRLSPLQVGFRTLVRGYDIGTFRDNEFATSINQANYPEYSRLLGSKIAVMNFEFRIPLFGTDQFGLIDFPLLPTEISLFFDGGVAWTRNDTPELTFETDSDQRIPVFSTGVAARINLFGYIIGQVYYAVPFQRPQIDGIWGFVIAPGW